MRKKDQVLIIGSGAVGRGLLAPKLIDAGFMVTFADVDRQLIDRLNQMKYYPLVGRGIFKWIGPVTAWNINEFMKHDDIDTKELTFDFDYIFVSVKANNLPHAAKSVKFIVEHNTKTPVIYIIENLNDAVDKFVNMIKTLGATISGAIVAGGIANVIVPLSPHQEQDISFTVYDPNAELVLEKVKGIDAPFINTARYVSLPEFNFEWMLKLYLHCSVHAFVAFWGIKHGFEYIHEVVTSSPHDKIVMDFMKLVADAILEFYGGYENEIRKRMQFEFKAMADHLMMDDNMRVSRDVLRKIEPDDRLIGLLYFLRKTLGEDVRHNASYKQLVELTNDAIKSIDLNIEDMLFLDCWDGLSDEDFDDYNSGVLEDLRDDWEKRFSNSSNC